MRVAPAAAHWSYDMLRRQRAVRGQAGEARRQADRAVREAERVPGVAQAEGEVTGAEILPRLRQADDAQRRNVADYEAQHKHRATVLDQAGRGSG